MSPSAKRPTQRALGVIGDEPNGVSYVRFMQPFAHLADLGFTLRTLGSALTLTRGPRGFRPDPRLLDGADFLIFPQMVASPLLAGGGRLDLIEPLCDEARARRVPIVYSADDALLGIEAHNPGFEQVQGSIANLESLLARADAFLVTTPELGSSFAATGRPVHVVPNAVDPERLRPRPRASADLRIGWSGSASHLDDLLMVLPAIRRLQERLAFRFVLFGLTPRPLAAEAEEARRLRPRLEPSRRLRADRFLELFALLRSMPHEHVPFGNLESFFTTLPSLDLDIGLCPLLDTPFNRRKSALKFYEYAACGTLSIASDVLPYAPEVALRAADDPAAWCAILEKYARDRAARGRALEEQRAFVLEQRTIGVTRRLWAAALGSILASGAGVRRETAAPLLSMEGTHAG